MHVYIVMNYIKNFGLYVNTFNTAKFIASAARLCIHHGRSVHSRVYKHCARVPVKRSLSHSSSALSSSNFPRLRARSEALGQTRCAGCPVACLLTTRRGVREASGVSERFGVPRKTERRSLFGGRESERSGDCPARRHCVSAGVDQFPPPPPPPRNNAVRLMTSKVASVCVCTCRPPNRRHGSDQLLLWQLCSFTE